jgi:Xaa-Pro aminopeptidase
MENRERRMIIYSFLLTFCGTFFAFGGDLPKVMSLRERKDVVNKITLMRLDTLLPKVMRQAGIDMWIIACNEDNLDPVFKTMIPFDSWCPITQILVFFDRGPEKGVERLNISRTNMLGFHTNAWDAGAWDREKKESQWSGLARIVKERDPRKIGINESDVIWAADGLTSSLKQTLIETIGPVYASRLESAEKPSILWLETLLDPEFELFERAVAISHAVIAEALSGRVITPGVTTVDDLRYYYWQRIEDLGLEKSFLPSFSIRGRDPREVEKFGKEDRVIRPGDLVHCDVGLIYLRYNTDHQEWAYVLRPGETEVPETFRKILAEGNRLQDIYAGEFKVGLSGNQILANILGKARAQGLGTPRIYSHSLGYYLHEPGPLIGLPWEQVNTGGRGDVTLVPNSCFTAELSVDAPVPEWGGKVLRLGIEQDFAFTERGSYFLDGRQTKFHLVK